MGTIMTTFIVVALTGLLLIPLVFFSLLAVFDYLYQMYVVRKNTLVFYQNVRAVALLTTVAICFPKITTVANNLITVKIFVDSKSKQNEFHNNKPTENNAELFQYVSLNDMDIAV
jgi:hypothetical protein